ncbi:MAG: TetR/AcrR family transcriptional regulator [Parachlamydiaceae bacterium]|nr:TetR/AcrR family transcriptional regulator [Parachlamydiaceae bacterium]
MRTESLRQNILQIAERLLKEKGYNGWSYQDISTVIGIKKASIHYYFPRKEDLGCELIEYYHHNSLENLTETCRKLTKANDKLAAFARLYANVLEQPNCYCLLGMLAADFMTLPDKMQTALRKSFEEERNWVAQVLEEGATQDLWDTEESSFELKAAVIVNCLQGMLLMARLEKNPQKAFFENAILFLQNLC